MHAVSNAQLGGLSPGASDEERTKNHSNLPRGGHWLHWVAFSLSDFFQRSSRSVRQDPYTHESRAFGFESWRVHIEAFTRTLKGRHTM